MDMRALAGMGGLHLPRMGDGTGSPVKPRRARRAKPIQPQARQPVDVPSGEVPTPHTLAHGGYALDQAAAIEREVMVLARVIKNREVLPIDSCLARGNITARQHAAGVHVYTLHLQSGFAERGRDSTTAIGAIRGGESGGKVAAAVHATRELAKMRQYLRDQAQGRYRDEVYAILMSICAHRESTGPRRDDARRWRRFKHGLTLSADFYQLPEDDVRA